MMLDSMQILQVCIQHEFLGVVVPIAVYLSRVYARKEEENHHRLEAFRDFMKTARLTLVAA